MTKGVIVMINFFTLFSEANIFGLISRIEGVLLLKRGFVQRLILSFALKMVLKAIINLIF